MSDGREVSGIMRGELRAVMRRAMHERWCGPAPRSCGTDCDGQPDPGELDAAVDAALRLIDGREGQD